MVRPATVLEFQRCPQIKKAEWIDCVRLAADIREAEALLEAMRVEYREKQGLILAKLAAGASIEDAGRIT